ncbi:MAG TPA: uroporphyrinogen decarboxylase family protein [Anaeromyxobacter sp.]|nr:uroporphyrinogen decarboxylase family protein [Anaeromyxobacter sp.]
MAEMTSRERVWAAVNHEEPDRVPLDLGGGGSTTLVVEAYQRLEAFWGLPRREPRIMSKAFRLAYLEEEALVRLGSDTRPLGVKGFSRTPSPTGDPDTFRDAWGVVWRRAQYPGGYYWELHGHPLAEATVSDLDRYPWPDPLDPALTAGLAEEVQALRAGPYAIMADGGFKSFWELGYMLRGLEQLLVDLVADPEFVTALMEKLLELNLAGTRRFLEIAGPHIQVFRAADDLATQNGLLISPEAYRAVLKPVYKRYFDQVHALTPAKLFYHSCGCVNELVGDLVEIGVDILNPVQVTAMGDTARLKERFGSQVTFWGAIDTQEVLPHGTPADVEREVAHRIHDLAPGGGYVVASVHNVQPDVPPENLLAMTAAVRKHGRYPLARSGG